MDQMQAAKSIQAHMQEAHRLWDAYREQGGDPATLLDEARSWRERAGEILAAVFEDDQVGESFLQMTSKASRLSSPFDLFKSGLELLEALLRDLGIEEPPPATKGTVAAAVAPAAPSAGPADAAGTPAAAAGGDAAADTRVETTEPAPEEKRPAPRIAASIGIVPAAPAPAAPTRDLGSSAKEPTPARGAADDEVGAEVAKVIAEVRVAIEMTSLPRSAREDHLAQLGQLERVFAGDVAGRDLALGRSSVRSLMHAADRVPNIASRLMILLDALES